MNCESRFGIVHRSSRNRGGPRQPPGIEKFYLGHPGLGLLNFSPSVAFVIDIEIADRNNRAAVDRLRLADQTSTMLNTGSTAQPQVVYARLANQCQRSEESITGRNDLKRPFIWTNPAEDILAKTERERKQVRTTATNRKLVGEQRCALVDDRGPGHRHDRDRAQPKHE